MLLQFTAHQQIEFLVSAPEFDICLKCDRIVALDQGIQKFVNGNGLITSIAFSKIVTLQHARHSVSGSQFYQVSGIGSIHPGGVEYHFSLLGLEYAENLVLIRLRILDYLFARESRTSCILATGITDHAREIADQEEGMMAQILKMTHFIEQDSMAQMQIGCRRIKARLDSEGPVGSELLLQLLFQQKLATAALDNLKLF